MADPRWRMLSVFFLVINDVIMTSLLRTQAYATVDAWCFPWVIFRLCSNNTGLLFGAKGYLALCEQLSDMWLSTLEIGAAQLRSVTEIAPKSPLLCVNRSPIQYALRAGAKVILIFLCVIFISFLNFILCTKFKSWLADNSSGQWR